MMWKYLNTCYYKRIWIHFLRAILFSLLFTLVAVPFRCSMVVQWLPNSNRLTAVEFLSMCNGTCRIWTIKNGLIKTNVFCLTRRSSTTFGGVIDLISLLLISFSSIYLFIQLIFPSHQPAYLNRFYYLLFFFASSNMWKHSNC